MTIRLDRSDRSTVIWCDCCPWWSEVCTNPIAALGVALDHEREYHPEQRSVEAHYSREVSRHAL